MISKKDLLCRIEFLNSDISALENEVDAQRREIDKLNKKMSSYNAKLERVWVAAAAAVNATSEFRAAEEQRGEVKKPVKRGRGRPRKNK